ncbi:MAG TPA: hypothetical protein VFM06_01385 [Candidatus Limnocylindria bacterium]|nr:hypothetical protein [Candidatus Limnocylindria bacterium]
MMAADRMRERVPAGAPLAMADAMPTITSDMAFSIGLFAGWLALVVWLVWPDPHCACCVKRVAERAARDRF